ncbi:MAG: UDP-2,3-diacylglucosamine diphosphatase [Pseudomonadota bacterium]
MRVAFAADVHLSADRPTAVKQFLELLHRAQRLDTLYLLGDVFDLWLGDDDARAPHPDVMSGLQRLTRQTDVRFMVGNHDFLVGDGFIADSGCNWLDDPNVIELGGERVLLMHGDTLCTDDTAYQAYRAEVRDPQTQSQFLSQSLDARLAYAQTLKTSSKAHHATVGAEITDVNADEVRRVMHRHRANTLIHGHTHRPAWHENQGLGRGLKRIVLSDWYRSSDILIWDADGYRHGSFTDLIPI